MVQSPGEKRPHSAVGGCLAFFLTILSGGIAFTTVCYPTAFAALAGEGIASSPQLFFAWAGGIAAGVFSGRFVYFKFYPGNERSFTTTLFGGATVLIVVPSWAYILTDSAAWTATAGVAALVIAGGWVWCAKWPRRKS